MRARRVKVMIDGPTDSENLEYELLDCEFKLEIHYGHSTDVVENAYAFRYNGKDTFTLKAWRE